MVNLKSLTTMMAFSLAATGCSSMSVQKSSIPLPTFDFIEYFEGQRRVSGWFSDRFGNVRRHFCGDFVGTLRDDGVFILDEKLVYTDGMVETRVWEVKIDDAGTFTAESDSLVGPAEGKLEGNALNMQYVMKVAVEEERTWELAMDDYMFLQPDGSLHNITQVKKFGVRIGTVSTQYYRPVAAETEQRKGELCSVDNISEQSSRLPENQKVAV